MGTSRMLRFIPVGIAAAVIIATCSDDKHPSDGGAPPGQAALSAAWEGEWDIDVVVTECHSGDTLLAGSGTEFLCEGRPIRFPIFPVEMSCEGTVTDERFDISCDTVYTDDGCRIAISVNWIMLLSGDDFSGTAMVQVEGTGTCDSLLCADFDFNGSRIGSGTAACDTLLAAHAPFDGLRTYAPAPILR